MSCALHLLVGFILLWSSYDIAAAERVRLAVHKNIMTLSPGNVKRFWLHGVAHVIFHNAGYKPIFIARPVKRLGLSLSHNEVDLISGTGDELSQYEGKFIRSKLPVALVPFYIYYDHRNKWQPTWPPDEIFKKKIGKSAHSSATLRDQHQLNISFAASFDAPVKMVNMGRVDYYIENNAGIVAISKNLLRSPDQGFSTKELFRKPIYAFFQNTSKGKQLVDVFDRELLRLYQNAEYGRLFYAKAPIYTGGRSVDEAVVFINKNYPELNIPPQPTGRDSATSVR